MSALKQAINEYYKRASSLKSIKPQDFDNKTNYIIAVIDATKKLSEATIAYKLLKADKHFDSK